MTGRKEIGNFCDQFGYDITFPKPHKNRKSKSTRQQKSYRRKIKKSYNDNKAKRNSNPTTSQNKRKIKSSTPIVCRKCGKLGHYVNKCWTKNKLNEIADEGLKQQLIQACSDYISEDNENSSSNKKTNDRITS